MKVLLTGASGNIGSHTLPVLLRLLFASMFDVHGHTLHRPHAMSRTRSTTSFGQRYGPWARVVIPGRLNRLAAFATRRLLPRRSTVALASASTRVMYPSARSESRRPAPPAAEPG
jgi:uncharacterized protein YbjT (DUF2867 family)